LKLTKGEFIKILIISLIIGTSIIFVLGCNIEKGKILVIQNNTTGEELEFYLPDNSFSLGYIHSVMKTPAEEFFYVNNNNEIVLQKTIYQSYGVGLPFLPEEGELSVEDGKFILYMNRTLKEINMIISPIPKHWLQIGDTKYQLMDILKEPDCSIKIYVHDESIIKNFINISSDVLTSNY
jgi:hypothetical protein